MVQLRTSLRPEFPTWSHFLRCFCRTEEQVIQCIQILQAIVDGGNDLPAEQWIDIPKSSVGMYTKCVSLLRSNGLIVKRDGHYTLSRDLLLVLDKVQDRWKELVNAIERGEHIQIR